MSRFSRVVMVNYAGTRLNDSHTAPRRLTVVEDDRSEHRSSIEVLGHPVARRTSAVTAASLGMSCRSGASTSPEGACPCPRRCSGYWSQKVAQLVSGHADYRENVPQRALCHVPVVNWHRYCPAIRVFHHVMATADPHDLESSTFKCSDYLCSSNGRYRGEHKALLSGNVKDKRQLVRDADLGNQCLQRPAQIIERRFAGRTVADGPDTWPELGRCTPNTVLILFEDVWYVHRPRRDTHRYCLLVMVRRLTNIDSRFQ
jgi:hypothetical protein